MMDLEKMLNNRVRASNKFDQINMVNNTYTSANDSLPYGGEFEYYFAF